MKINKATILYIFIILILGIKLEILLSLLIAFLHELAHLLVAYHFKVKGEKINFLPVGFSLQLKDIDDLPLREDIIISLSGPLFNFINFFIFFILYKFVQNESIKNFYILNFYIGAFNLLPCFPLDGGRVLKGILVNKFSYKKGYNCFLNISLIFSSIFMILYISMNLAKVNNYFWGSIAIYIGIMSLREKERSSYIIMGDILKKKSKFNKRGYIQNTNISICSKSSLLFALELVDKYKYTIFTLLDENMNVIGILYEEQIVEGLKNFGNISIDELITKI